jgi:hypothetical protein
MPTVRIALVVQDRVHNAGQGGADAVVGGALAVDDAVGRAPDLGIDVVADPFGQVDAAQPGEPVERYPPDRHQRPGEDLRVAVFADDVGVDVVRIDAAVAPEQAAEAGGVERGPGAKDAAGGHAALAGETGGEMRHHVHRVAGDDEDGVRGVFEDRRHDLVEHLGVSLEQMEARLPRLLADARTEDDDPTAGQVFVVAGADVERMGERYGVTDVVRLRGGTGGVPVHQDDLAADPLHDQGVGGGGPDEAGADDADLHG